MLRLLSLRYFVLHFSAGLVCSISFFSKGGELMTYHIKSYQDDRRYFKKAGQFYRKEARRVYNAQRAHCYHEFNVVVDHHTKMISIELIDADLFLDYLPYSTLELFIGKWNDENKMRQVIEQIVNDY